MSIESVIVKELLTMSTLFKVSAGALIHKAGAAWAKARAEAKAEAAKLKAAAEAELKKI